MTESEARQILKLSSTETLESARTSIQARKDKLVKKIAEATPGSERDSFLERLDKLDRAVSALSAPLSAANRKRSSKRPLVIAAVALVACLLAAGIWLAGESARQAERERVAAVQEAGQPLVEAALAERKWPEAEEELQKMISDGVAKDDLSTYYGRLEAGKAEELRQRLAFLDGETRASVAAGEWDKASDRVTEIRALEGEYKTIDELTMLIATGRKNAEIAKLSTTVDTALLDRDWAVADQSIKQLQSIGAPSDKVAAFFRQIIDGKERERQDRAKSLQLTTLATGLDKGVYSPKAMDALREALALDPKNTAASALFLKMSAYTRTISVPGDYDTLDEALAEARGRDEIVLAKGTFKASLNVPSGIQIRGAGYNETFIQCPATESSVVTVGNGDEQTVISDLCLQHSGFEYGAERFAVLTVLGSRVALTSVKILNGGGHGASILNGGVFSATNCRFTGNAWSGVAVTGAGTRADLKNCRLSENFHNGLIVWDGGAVTVDDTQVDLNNRSGASVSSSVQSKFSNSRFEKNRDAGIAVLPNGAADINRSSADLNSIAGVVVYPQAAVSINNSRMQGNNTAGLVLGRGASLLRDSNNKVVSNKLTQRLIEADLTD